MKIIDNFLKHFDSFQQKHPSIGFPIAVNHKYSQNHGGRQVALIAYYGFLSIFPLILVLTTIIQLLPLQNRLRSSLISHLTHYVPIIGTELQRNIHGLHHNGLGIVIALVVTVYGMRGVANVFQDTLNHVWLIPEKDRPGFPKKLLISLGIIVIAGLAFVLAAGLSAFTTLLGHSTLIRILTSIVSFLIMLLALMLIFRIGVAAKQGTKKIFVGALIATIALQIIQIGGGYLITHELKHLSSLYGLFAIVLGIIFWLYLVAQVALYAVEATAVQNLKLWPVSLFDSQSDAKTSTE